MTNKQIIEAFTAKNTANTSKSKALSIRNGKLYSYALLIGEYVSQPDKGFQGLVVYDYTANGLGFRSQTTSQHVSLLKRVTQYHPRRVIGQDE
jgi:hypothetical protein